MKRKYSLFPLMAVTALSLTLAACDDKKDDTAADTAASTEMTTDTAVPPATDTAAMDSTMPATTTAVQAEGATAYATAEGAANGAVFLTLHNTGTTDDRLVGATTPVAATVELHQSATDENGVATMTKVDAIDIAAGEQITLSPSGYHIMLMGLNAPLSEGTPFDITLDFETGADVTLPVTVVAPVAATDAAPMDHDAMDHGSMDQDTEDETSVTTDESPAPADSMTDTTATDEPVATSVPEGMATPDMDDTSSAPDASTTAPTAQ